MPQGIGWCGIHKCPGHDCFHIHYPDAYRKPGQKPETPEELTARIAAAHLAKQEEHADEGQ